MLTWGSANVELLNTAMNKATKGTEQEETHCSQRLTTLYWTSVFLSAQPPHIPPVWGNLKTGRTFSSAPGNMAGLSQSYIHQSWSLNFKGVANAPSVHWQPCHARLASYGTILAKPFAKCPMASVIYFLTELMSYPIYFQ